MTSESAERVGSWSCLAGVVLYAAACITPALDSGSPSDRHPRGETYMGGQALLWGLCGAGMAWDTRGNETPTAEKLSFLCWFANPFAAFGLLVLAGRPRSPAAASAVAAAALSFGLYALPGRLLVGAYLWHVGLIAFAAGAVLRWRAEEACLPTDPRVLNA